MIIWNAKHCGFRDSRRIIVAKLEENPRFHIRAKPGKSSGDGIEATGRIISPISFVRLKVAADTVVVLDLRLWKYGFMEVAHALLPESIRVALGAIEMDAVTAVE